MRYLVWRKRAEKYEEEVAEAAEERKLGKKSEKENDDMFYHQINK